MALEEFRSLNIDFVSHQEALDTSTPMGKAMFTIIAAMAELERSVIRERVIAGIDYARAHGTKTGKPVGRPRAVFRRDEVVKLRTEGRSWSRIARQLGISSGSARRAYMVDVRGVARTGGNVFPKTTRAAPASPGLAIIRHQDERT
jgi:DNA invertase Pin-like site-specific DNA recombinase